MKNLKFFSAGVALLTISAALPAQAESRIQTQAVPSETIIGPRAVNLQSVPVLPIYFTLPIQLRVATNKSITTNTPITDQFPMPEFTDQTNDGVLNLDDIPRHRAETSNKMREWAAKVSGCLSEQPQLMRMAGGSEVPIQIDGKTGRIVTNANNRSVCPL